MLDSIHKSLTNFPWTFCRVILRTNFRDPTQICSWTCPFQYLLRNLFHLTELIQVCTFAADDTLHAYDSDLKLYVESISAWCLMTSWMFRMKHNEDNVICLFLTIKLKIFGCTLVIQKSCKDSKKNPRNYSWQALEFQ